MKHLPAESDAEILSPQKSYAERYMYLFLAGVAAIPVFIITQTFVNAAGIHEDEAVSVAITALFITGIFAGRFMGKAMALHMRTISKKLLFALGILIIIIIAWLSFHSDFQWRHRPTLNMLLFWLPMVIMSFAFGILIKLAREVTNKQLQQVRSLAAHTESELNLLQSQLSPHFLFNTLNNLYGISISDHQKLPPLLLKLSDLLRYSVYDANASYVRLQEEMNYIENYIDFERIRIGERLVLNKEFAGTYDPNTMIAPMLLIVFIENAFKHSKNTPDEKVYVDTSLKLWENWILFSIQNSRSIEERQNVQAGRTSGIGLANVRKRLDLLYPGQYQLDIVEDKETFKVVLQLKAK